VPSGRSELRVDRLTPQGTVSQRLTVPFAPIALAALPENRRYLVRRGNNLWMIARRTYGDGLNYTIIYAANAGHIRDPDLIYPGQIFALPRS
jgi:nucleoid-associated protein YgaU